MSRLIITAGIGSPWLQLSVLARLIIQAMERSQSYVTSDNNPRIGNASADSETSPCRRPLHAPEATSDNLPAAVGLCGLILGKSDLLA